MRWGTIEQGNNEQAQPSARTDGRPKAYMLSLSVVRLSDIESAGGAACAVLIVGVEAGFADHIDSSFDELASAFPLGFHLCEMQ